MFGVTVEYNVFDRGEFASRGTAEGPQSLRDAAIRLSAEQFYIVLQFVLSEALVSNDQVFVELQPEELVYHLQRPSLRSLNEFAGFNEVFVRNDSKSSESAFFEQKITAHIALLHKELLVLLHISFHMFKA